MASVWPAPTYPPRRSRSRSPYRGSYPPPPRPPYPEAGYGDAYRADWDAYDRDRAWASYERERAAMDYTRRGRSRSPGFDDAGRKRRRSMSPYDGRYDPRPRYGDDHDAHSRSYGRGSPHRGSYPPPYSSSRHGPQDPHTLDYPASLKQFADWFRFNYPQQAQEEDAADKAAEQEAGDGSKPRNGIKSKWEKYKKDFSAIQIARMFDHHRKSPWFAEKYDPAPQYETLRKRVRQQGWKGRWITFLDDVEAGKFDAEVLEPQKEPELPSPAKENGATAANGVAPVPAGGEEPKTAGAEDEQMDDETGDQDATRAETNGRPSNDPRRNNRGEEMSVPNDGNQVMIRTIPPDIGRVKLEEVCAKMPGFVYLALGEPVQRRNFYRAGWIKFRDDADMPSVMSEISEQKIEGFKLHVTHLLRPFVNRIRYAPEVASMPNRLEKDLVNAKTLAAILEAEYNQLRTAKFSATPDDPPAENGDTVPKEEDTDETMTSAEQPTEEEDPEPRESGSAAVERRVEKLMEDLKESGAVDPNDEKLLNAKKTVISLDLYLAYLRAAFHTCYYCAAVTDHAEELQRKCIKHVRKPLSKMLLDEIKAAEAAEKAEKETPAVVDEDGDVHVVVKEEEKSVLLKEKPTENRDWKRNDERWLDWLDSKIALLINRDGVDPREYGGKNYDEELSKAVEPFIKQEDEGKFRCKTCQKLFKATAFVEKHIANKHGELVKQLEEVPYFNNFALDPHRIQPLSYPPPASGNNQPAMAHAYGFQGGAAAYAPPNEWRPPPHGYHNPYPPVAYPYPAHFDMSAPGYQFGAPPAYPPRRDDRRLSERIGAYAPGFDGAESTLPVPAGAGLPAKPLTATLEPGPGGRRGARSNTGPPPPPPPDAKEDPRAAAGRKVSYHDMDLVAEGDVELTY